MFVSASSSEQSRQRLVAAVISTIQGLPHLTQPHELELIALYQRGRLTIDEVVYSLESRAGFAQRPA